MIVRWEQKFELLRYLECEAFCIKVLVVVTLNLILLLLWLLFHKAQPRRALLGYPFIIRQPIQRPRLLERVYKPMRTPH